MPRILTVLVCLAAAALTHWSAAGPETHATEMVHLTALEDMTASCNSTLEKSLARERRMKAYIAEQELGDAFAANEATGTHDAAMSFGEALHQAVLNVQAHGAGGGAGSGDMQRKINAYEKLAQASWSRLQQSMAAVNDMTRFLRSQGQMSGYMRWSADQATAAHQARMDDAQANAQAAQARAAQAQQLVQDRHAAFTKAMAAQRQARLKWAWDRHAARAAAHRGAYDHPNVYDEGNAYAHPNVYDHRSAYDHPSAYDHRSAYDHPNVYAGYGTYSDHYFEDEGWGLSATGNLIRTGTEVTK